MLFAMQMVLSAMQRPPGMPRQHWVCKGLSLYYYRFTRKPRDMELPEPLAVLQTSPQIARAPYSSMSKNMTVSVLLLQMTMRCPSVLCTTEARQALRNNLA